MDPNENLRQQLELAGHVADCSEDYCPVCLNGAASRLAELVLALNHWIELKGALPDRWRNPSGPILPKKEG